MDNSRAPIDVVIPVYTDVALTRSCIESVLNCSGPELGRVILVHDCGPDPAMLPMLRQVRRAEPQVVLLVNERNLGFVSSANRGMAIGQSDVVLLNSDTLVTPGWLAGLRSAAESDPRIAALTPLSNNGFLCSVPVFQANSPRALLEPFDIDLSGLPAFTSMPTAVGYCLWLRRDVLDRIGLFDPAYGVGYNEENDWCQRARAEGHLVGRANRVFVFHEGHVSFADRRRTLDAINLRRLVSRYPRYPAEIAAFDRSAEARIAADHVARALASRQRAALASVPSPSISAAAGPAELVGRNA